VSTTASNTATLQAVLSSYVNTAARITYQNLQVSDLFLDAYSLNRRFADSYSIVDDLYLDVGTSFADSYSIIDAHFIRTSTDKTSDLGLSDEQIITIFYSRSFDEQVSLSSNTFLLQGKVLGDTQLITDDFSKTVTYFRDLASAFTLDDFLTAGVEDLKKHTEGDKGNIFGFDSVLDYDLSTPLQTVQTLVSTPAVLFSTGFSSNSSVTDAQVKSFGKNVSLNPFIFAQRSPAEIADSLAYNLMLSSGAVTAPTKYSFLFDMSTSEFSNQIFPYISTDKRDAAIYQLTYVDKLLDPDGPNSGSNLNYERTTFIADLFDGDYDGDVRLPEIYRNLLNFNNAYNSDGAPFFSSGDGFAINTAAFNNLSQANYDLFSASSNGTDTTDYTHTHVIPDILTGAYDIPESQAFMSDEIQIDLQTITASSTPNQSAFNASTFN